MDNDLRGMTRDQLIEEIKRLRAGIRKDRDSSGRNLCWHHPELWRLLPEPMPLNIAVPPWPKFIADCADYRRSLDKELPNAPVDDRGYGAAGSDGERP